MNTFFMMLHNGFFAMIPALGFALLFNVPTKALKYCAMGGAVGHMMRYLLVDLGLSIEMASFLAASCIGFLGVYWSQRFLAHPKVFTVAAVIPMVPGVFAFKAMIALVEIDQKGFSPDLLAALMENLLKASFIIAGLAIGLALPGLLFYRRRSVV
ncbi:threonine/serine exporter family protein [Thaumasiovibrio sp. DFM-14]|uniref:threonine/serine exporter family protein n=1 Tax=Thaumasiovibrio sp. DFM-14 TaxID=3384792 RepID=UPI0039A27439